MRFRHAPFLLLLAAAVLLLTAAAPAPGTDAPLGVGSPLAAPKPSAPATATAKIDVTDAIVAMTAGPSRTGSAVVVAPGLLVTSTHVVKEDKNANAAIMTVEGQLVTFQVVARDKRLGLVLLRAPVQSKSVVWGRGRDLKVDSPVTAIGIGSGLREVYSQPGKVSSAAFANGNDLLVTDIRIDPLVEGGPLTTADGKVVGIIVAKGQGDLGGQLGWAVSSEAVQEFVGNIQRQQAAAAAAATKKKAMRWVAWAVLLAFVGVMVLAGRSFRRWYKRMEAREEAAMAAEEEARRAAEAAGAVPAEE